MWDFRQLSLITDFMCKLYLLLKESVVYICAVFTKVRDSSCPWELFALCNTWPVLEEKLMWCLFDAQMPCWCMNVHKPVLECYYWTYQFQFSQSFHGTKYGGVCCECLVMLQLLQTNFLSKFILACRFSGLPIMKLSWPPVALTAG